MSDCWTAFPQMGTPGLRLRDVVRFLPSYKPALGTADYLSPVCMPVPVEDRTALNVFCQVGGFRGVGVCSLSVTIQLLPKVAVPALAPSARVRMLTALHSCQAGGCETVLWF